MSLADHPAWTTWLEFAVPMHIREIEHRDGPDHHDWRRIRKTATELGTYGDRLMFKAKNGTPRDGPSAGELAGRVAEAIAVMSYQPGGVTIFGQHWETRTPEHRLAKRNLIARLEHHDMQTRRQLAAHMKANHANYDTPGGINTANRWLDNHERRNHPSLGPTEPTW